MLITKVNDLVFDLERARNDVLHILQEYETNNGQLSLTHTPEAIESEKLYQATGSLYDSENKVFKYSEADFTVFNDAFKHTYLYEIYKAVPNIGRFRIMVIDGPKCYTIHKDFTTRYHLVLQTNPHCYFVFPDNNEVLHIPADGNLYLVDTIQHHTFLNGSREKRIHLVMDNLADYSR